jgi:hypothetical protein
VAGGAAGIIVVLSTSGIPTVIPPEAELTFRLEAPASFSTKRSQQAFQPVSQQDYAGQSHDRYQQSLGYRPPHYVTAPPPYYYGGFYPPYYGWGYYYPAPAFGFYGFGFVGPRVVIRGRGFRR